MLLSTALRRGLQNDCYPSPRHLVSLEAISPRPRPYTNPRRSPGLERRIGTQFRFVMFLNWSLVVIFVCKPVYRYGAAVLRLLEDVIDWLSDARSCSSMKECCGTSTSSSSSTRTNSAKGIRVHMFKRSLYATGERTRLLC